MGRVKCSDCGMLNNTGNVYCSNCSGQLYRNCYEEYKHEDYVALFSI